MGIVRDLRLIAANARQDAGVVLLAVLILGGGVAVNTTLASVLDRLILRPIAAARPEGLRVISAPLSRQELEAIGAATTLEAVSGFRVANVLVETPHGPRAMQGMLVSDNYFDNLGISARVGRAVTGPAAPPDGLSPVLVLSEKLWRADFGAHPEVIGDYLRVNDRPLPIAGVLPREFTGTTLASQPELFIPMALAGELRVFSPEILNRGAWINVIVRMRSATAAAAAEQEINALITRAGDRRAPVTLLTVADAAVGRGEKSAVFSGAALLAAVGIVILLIVGLNVGGLWLVRAQRRRSQVALQAALGASRGVILRQTLLECGCFSVCGAVVGVLLSAWIGWAIGTIQLTAAIPVVLPEDPSIRTFTWSLLFSASTAAVGAVAPTWAVIRQPLGMALRSDGGAVRSSVVGGALVVAQIAMSVLLLTLALQLAATLRNQHRANLGFDIERLIVLQPAPVSGMGVRGRSETWTHDVIERVRALPAVDSAAVALMPPFASGSFVRDITTPGGDRLTVAYNAVDNAYFATTGIPIVRGGGFSDEDVAQVVVNQTLARSIGGLEAAVGSVIELENPAREQRVRVVGVVRCEVRKYPRRRERHREGVARQGAARMVVTCRQAAHQRQRRRAFGIAVRGGDLRAREGSIHRCDVGSDRPVRDGPPGYHFPR